jgi:hypothetical protein
MNQIFSKRKEFLDKNYYLLPGIKNPEESVESITNRGFNKFDSSEKASKSNKSE